MVLQRGLRDNWFSGRRDQPVANSVPHTQPALIRRPELPSGERRFAPDLRIPPGNRLRALVGDLTGYHALRVNDPYRIVFRFEGQDAHDVRCTDYH